MERECGHRCFCSLGLPDAVGISRHGPDIGKIRGRDLAVHFGVESLKPASLEKNTQRLTAWKKSQHLRHEGRWSGIAEMWVV